MTRETLALRTLTLALAVGCFLGSVHVLGVIGFHVPFDPNEGWNAAFAKAVIATGSPYPPPRGLLVNNYPPLSFYLVAAVSRLTGDAIVAGRLVALLALLAVAVSIARAVILTGCSRLEAAFAALLFVAGLMLTSDYVGMDDPQLLGHAVALGGFLLVLPEPRSSRAMVGAALLFVLAFFIKHNLVVLPVATAAWLLLADRRQAGTFIASGVIFLLIGLGIFKEIYGLSLFDQIASARTYSVANLWSGIVSWLPWGAPLIFGAAMLFALSHRDRYAVLCLIYALFGIAAGVFFLGGAGVDANALFDADIALALCAGLLLNRLQFPIWQTGATLLYAVPLVLGLRALDADWRDSGFWLNPMAEERAAADTEIALIRSAKGPVLCETLALCYWAGRPAMVDVFNIGQAFRAGTLRDDDLVKAIDDKHYALIEFEQLAPPPLTPRIQNAVNQGYKIVLRGDDGIFFAPR
jgi:hypothetical protein